MKKCERVCLSFDKETRSKLANLSIRLNMSLSQTVREAISFLNDHIKKWR